MKQLQQVQIVFIFVLTLCFAEYRIPVAQPNTPFFKGPEINLQSENILVPYATTIDTADKFLYIGASETPAKITKVDLKTFSVVGTITAENYNEIAGSNLRDEVTGMIFFVTTSDPQNYGTFQSTVLKVAPNLTIVDTLQIPDSVFGHAIDQLTGTAFFSTEYMAGAPSVPLYRDGVIWKIDIRSSPMRLLGNLTLLPKPDPPTLSSAVVETATRMVYFAQSAPGSIIHNSCFIGTLCVCPNSFCPPSYNGTSIIYQINMDTLQQVNYVDTGIYTLRYGVIDTVSRTAYWGSLATPKLARIQLDTMTVDSITISDISGMQTGMIDTLTGFAFYGTFLSSSASILRFNLTSFSLVDRVSVGDTTIYGTTTGGVIDTTGYAYFTFASPYSVFGNPTGFGRVTKFQVADINCRYANCMPCLRNHVCNPCPVETPVLCPSGHCSSTVDNCVSRRNCPQNQPFICANGNCVSSPSFCIPNCTETDTCWDGSCISNVPCKPVPSCPNTLPMRCPDGTCKFNSSQCGQTFQCQSNICADGTCSETCPDYNGCASPKPYMCADGNCAVDESFCVQGNCSGILVRCWDGTCVQNRSQLMKKFARGRKVDDFSVSFQGQSTFSSFFKTPDLTSNVVGVTAPPSTFGTAENAIKVSSVPDSQVTPPATGSLLSQVVKITLGEGTQNSFSNPVTIKLAADINQNVNLNRVCLAFWNVQTSQWECQSQVTQNGGLFEGTTPHFTDFALLLQADCSNLGNCNNHGRCSQDGLCICDAPYAQPDCSRIACPGNCSNHGTCNPVNGICTCDYGYAGSSCSILDCPGTPDCNGNGQCIESQVNYCLCNVGWTGFDCSTPVCPNGCSGHGTCNSLVDPPTCDCRVNFTGNDCSLADTGCPGQPDCSAHGSCQNQLCTCDSGWVGNACNIAICPGYDAQSGTANCNRKGDCVNGVCNCDPMWSGASCSIVTCPGNNCTSHGTCYTASTTPVCNCDVNWNGDDCSNKVTDDSSDNNKNSPNIIYIATAAGAIVLIVAAVVIGMLTIRWSKRKSRKALQEVQVEMYNEKRRSSVNSLNESSASFKNLEIK